MPPTVREVYDSLSDKQREMTNTLVGEAIVYGETTIDVYKSLNLEQRTMVDFMISAAKEEHT